MWNALRSDFQEFVSTVSNDTSTVLSKIDATMNDGEGDDSFDAQEEGEDSKPMNKVNHAELKEIMTLLRDHPGTYTEALSDEDEKVAVEEFLADFSIEAKTDDIAEVLKEHEDTVKKHFEELVPTSVTYEEFWQRYFYRCNEERIAHQLAEETERARQARAEAIENGIKSVTNFFGGAVKAVAGTIAPEHEHEKDGSETPTPGINLFGAKGRPPFVMNSAVSETDDDDLQEDDEEELGWDDDDDDDFDDDDNEADRSGIESHNTEQIEFTDKVSEDLQERLKQAELERDQIQQTVHLQAEEIKSLKAKLSDLPIEEHGTNELEEMKLKLFEKDSELAALKSKLSDDDMDHGDRVAKLARQLGNLSTGELAQLKENVFGISEENVSASAGDDEKVLALEQQVQELTETLSAKESELSSAQEMLQSTTLELEATQNKLNSDQANANIVDTAMKDAQAKLSTVQGDVHALQAENEQLKQEYQKAQDEFTSQLSSMKEQQAASEKQVALLTNQLEDAMQKAKESEDGISQLATLREQQASFEEQVASLTNQLEDAMQKGKESGDAMSQLAMLREQQASFEEQVASLTKQLEEALQRAKQSEEALAKKEAELSTAKQAAAAAPAQPPSTPDSMSTGVKVEDTSTFATPATKLDLDEDEVEDDWGDDWD